jgi:hypothetical protein
MEPARLLGRRMVVFNLFYEEWRETGAGRKPPRKFQNVSCCPVCSAIISARCKSSGATFIIAKRLYVFPEPSVSNDHRGKGA